MVSLLQEISTKDVKTGDPYEARLEAAIGGIADGSSGAGTGAAVGATFGALKKGDSIVIPRGRLLEFTMKAPAPVKVQQPK